MNQLRVFHLIKSLGRGGAEMLLPEGLRFADRERFRYSYGYFLPWKNAMVPALQEQGVDVTCFGGRHNLQILLAARRVAAHLRSRRIHLLHCHMPIAGAVGRIAARISGIRVVYTEHNLQERFHPLTRRLNLATWRWQHRVVAVSRDVAQSIQSHAGSRVPVEVVLNGVDTGRFHRAATDGSTVRTKHGIPPEAPVIGTVAVFRVQKRLQDWVTAARLIRERHPASHFLLVGDGPLREDVVAAVGAAGLRDVVHLPGLQEDVRPFLAAMDVYMMSSVFEGLPVALLEAMSMECAPVCTAVGGIPELIHHGENGLLTPPGRPELLAGVVGDLLADTGGLTRLAAAARATVQTRFSMQRMTAELESIYLEVIEECGNSGEGTPADGLRRNGIASGDSKLPPLPRAGEGARG